MPKSLGKTFNRTFKELKQLYRCHSGIEPPSFNRTFKELKREADRVIIHFGKPFNRTFKELKLNMQTFMSQTVSILLIAPLRN